MIAAVTKGMSGFQPQHTTAYKKCILLVKYAAVFVMRATRTELDLYQTLQKLIRREAIIKTERKK